MSELPDETRTVKLIARILSGDRDAYAEIVDTYQDRVRASLAGYCRSADEVEEYCHIAFVQAYVKIEEFDAKRGTFATWLLVIARNCLLSELRRRRSEGERSRRYLELAASAPNPYEDYERARQTLERCLEQLKPGERGVLREKYGKSRSSEEIAEGAGRKPSAVRMQLLRIRERLRACVGGKLALGTER